MALTNNSWLSTLSKGNRINLGITVILIILGIIFYGDFPQYGGNYGFWSVMPPLDWPFGRKK